jgi:hypothetical protein
MSEYEHREANGFSERNAPQETASGNESQAAQERPQVSGEMHPLQEGANGSDREPDWHVEAGRKGGQRFHQLIQRGLQYEQEHGLKRGRQRLRQLVQEGRLYEQEHGLAPKGRKPRGGRLSRVRADQLLQSLCRILYRLAKPAHREKIAKMLQALDGEKKE